ncbi:MAG TPA: hypothetical protein PK082_01275 [Phycisphaerae bacterium]|nr:hypothetical protein [Phycisphaerae bacterium]
MLEQFFLREHFESLLAEQKKAADAYGKLAIDLNDPALQEKVAHLVREKQRHVQLTERLLEILD